MTLLELLAGKGATPEAVEASIRATVQDEVKQALAALQSGEQTALDNIDTLADKLLTRIISELPPAIRKELVGLKITNTTIIEQENKSA